MEIQGDTLCNTLIVSGLVATATRLVPRADISGLVATVYS